jgi:hypothetical protein
LSGAFTQGSDDEGSATEVDEKVEDEENVAMPPASESGASPIPCYCFANDPFSSLFRCLERGASTFCKREHLWTVDASRRPSCTPVPQCA